MAHNFKEGINWIADPTGATALSGHYFVSDAGNDSNAGSPDAPFLTLGRARTASAAGNTIVVGTSLKVDTLPLSNAKLLADGYVVINGSGANGGNNGSRPFSNLILTNFNDLTVCTLSNGVHNNNFFINCNRVGIFGNGGNPSLYGCTFVNCMIETGYATKNILLNHCRFINCQLAGVGLMNLNNCHVDATSMISVSTLNGSYNNLEVTPTSATNNLTNPVSGTPQYANALGLDFTLLPNSDHIGVAASGENIALGRLGTSFFQGVAALTNAVNNQANVAFNGSGEIQLINAAVEETIVLDVVEYDFLRYLGKIRISGLLDLVNNVPDNNNALTNPNYLTLELRWAGLDGVFTGWKMFRWNEVPTQNADGKTNGETGYSWADNALIKAKSWQARMTIRNNRITA